LSRAARLVMRDEAVGDVMEEYAAGNHGALWACRQLLSSVRRPSLSSIGADVSYALRALRRQPGFAVAAIAPIALGVGINTGVFSLLDAVALQPVPASNPGELVTVYQDFRGVKERRVYGARAMFSLPEYLRYRDAARTLTGVAAFSRFVTATLGGDTPREIDGALVSCNYFDVLQARPRIGTGFTAANCDAPDAPPSIVLSHELWTRTFASDPAITSRTMTLNGREFAIAGVAPAGFGGIDITRVVFFAPIATQPILQPDQRRYDDPAASWLTLVGRRTPGATIAAIRAELDVIAHQIDLEQPGRTTNVSVAPARALSIPQARRDIFSVATIVLAAFGLILLVACANVANLLLARGAARSKEIAVRLSLGISRARLVQQLLTESMIIAFAGAIAGTLLARWSFQSLFVFLLSLVPIRMPALDIRPALDLNVLLFATVVTVITGLVFGLVPALQSSKLDLRALLNRDTAGGGRRAAGWLRASLVGVQAAVCTVLLIVAALLLRAVYVAETVEPGFDYRGIAVVSFDLRGAGADARRSAAFQEQLLLRVSGMPGVDAVAQAGRTPLSPGRWQTTIRLPDRDAWQDTDFATVSTDYFALVGTPIVRGRTFDAGELRDGSRAVIVTESVARRYWPERDPIGQTLLMALGPTASVALEVVGVARDAQVARIGDSDTNYIYLPVARDSSHGFNVLVRSRLPLSAIAPAVRDVARALEPALVVTVSPLEDNLSFWRSVSRLTAGVSGALGLLALLLASVGIYGVVSYVVNRRLREMAIRVMLGASPRDVRRMLLRQMLRPVVAGVAIGVAGAAAVSQVLSSVLFGVSPFDPIAFVVAPLLLVAVAAAASLAPARRALARDPMTALRCD
jgi:predicted permease